jgi:hypothetical protein
MKPELIHTIKKWEDLIMRNKPLTVEIVDGLLSITIGVDILCYAINVAHGKQQGFNITDNDVFANEILMELLHEEDGVNSVHRMLDYAAQCSVEYGGEGFELLPLPTDPLKWIIELYLKQQKIITK